MTGALIDATAGRPGSCPVYVSLTSGDVSEQVKASLQRGRRHADAPRRGRGLRGDRPARRLGDASGRAAARRGRGDAGWPALAAAHVTWGADDTPDPLAGEAAPGAVAREVLGEREALALLAAAGIAVTPWVAVPADPDAVVAAWRDLGCVPIALKHDVAGLAHKSEAGGVCPWPRGRTR